MTRTRRIALAVPAAAVFILLLLYALRGVIIEPRLNAFLVSTMESSLGLQVTIGDIDGSYLASIEVKDLRTVGRGTTGPVASLDAERIRARYSILSLLSGMEAFLGKLRIDIQGAGVELVLLGGEEESQRPESPPGEPVKLPGVLPEVNIRDSDLSVEGSGYAIHGGRIRLVSDNRGGAAGSTSIDAGIGAFRISHRRLAEEAVSLTASLVWDGGGIDIRNLAVGEEAVVTGGRIDLSSLPRSFTADVETTLFSRRLDLGLSMEGPLLDMTVQAEEVRLEDLFSVLLVPEIELAGTLSAEAAVSLDTGDIPGLEGDLTIEWAGARAGTFSADVLEGEVSARDNRLKVETLAGRSEGNLVSVTGFSLSSDALFEGEWNALVDSLEGTLALHLQDVPALLAQGNYSVPGLKEDVPPHRVDLDGEVRGRTLSFTGGRLEVEGGSLDLKPSSLTFPAAGSGWGDAALHLDLVADFPELAVLNRLFPLPALGGSLAGEVLLDGAFSSLSGSVSVEARSLAVGGRSVGDVTLDGDADGTMLTVHRGTVRLAQDAGDLEVRELAAPSKELVAGEWKGLLQGLAGSLRLRTASLPGLLAALGLSVPERDVPSHVIDLEGSAGGGRITVSKGSFESEPGTFTIERGEISFPPPDRQWDETSLDVSFKAEVPDLGRTGEILGVSGLEGSLSGEIALSGELTTLQGSASLTGTGLSFRGLPAGDLSLTAEADRTSARVTSLELARGEDRLTLAGAFDLKERTFSDVSLQVALNDLGDYLAEPGKLAEGTALEGSIEIDGSLSALEGSVRIAADSAQGSAALSGDLQVSMEESRHSLLLRELSVAREGVELGLDQPSTIRWSSPEGLSVEDFSLHGDTGIVRLDGTMSPEGDTSMVLKVTGLTGEGWLDELAGDRFTFSGADLSAEVSGPVRKPMISASGTVAEFRSREAPGPVSVEFDIRYSAEGISIGQFIVTGESVRHIVIEGNIPYDPLADDPFLPAELSASAQFAIPELKAFAFLLPTGYAVGGRLEGTVSLFGAWESPTGEVDLKIRDLQLPKGLEPAPPGPLNVDCEIDAVRGGIALKDLRVESPALTARASGNWSKAPALISVIRGEEEFLQGEISLDGSFEARDLSWTARGIDAIRSAGGALKGTVSVSGIVNSPDVIFGADLDGVAIRLRGGPPASEISGRLSLEGGTLSVSGLTGDLGGAPFDLSGTLSGIGEDDLDFDLAMKGAGLLLYRNEGISVRADADLAARGPLSKLGISGSLMLVDSRYVKNIDLLGSVGGSKAPKVKGKGFLFSFRDPPLRDLVFDLRFGTKDPFLIKNQFIRAEISPDLRLTGTGEEPALVGKVSVDTYRAQLPTGVMRGEDGTVAFLQGEPGRPWIEVQGGTRMMGYDVTMQITGFADDPKIVFSSSPPLPGDEVLLMVLAGTPPRSGDKPAAASTGAALSIFLARSFLGRFLGGDSDETDDMILDRLETEVGRDITESGDPTIDSTFRLREGLLWEGDTLYLTGAKDRYDDFNYGLRFVYELQNKDDKGQD